METTILVLTIVKYSRDVQALSRQEGTQFKFRDLYYKTDPHALTDAPFEEVFKLPPAEAATTDNLNWSLDSEESSMLVMSTQMVDLTPMERFLIMSPTEEPFYIEARALLAAMGLNNADEQSAHLRVGSAKSLAAEVRTHGRKPEALVTVSRDREEHPGPQGHPKNEMSWLDLNDSQESHCGATRVRKRRSRRNTRGTGSPQTS